MLKSFCPGFYDLANGGVMSTDDQSNEANARREVSEELGIARKNTANIRYLETIKF